MKVVLKKEIFGACARDRSDEVSKGEPCTASLRSPLLWISRAGEIQKGKNLGRKRPRFLNQVLEILLLGSGRERQQPPLPTLSQKDEKFNGPRFPRRRCRYQYN
ncbi:MAG: hypothetical protein PWK00_10590 [Coxiella burnetii]|nr:hypothetical protein [Coxiella burnetii]